MNLLINPHITFDYAGHFVSEGNWIHPDRIEKTYELIYIVCGKVHMYDEVIGNIDVGEGQVLVLEPCSRHYGTSYSERVSFYWIHFYLNEEKLPFSKRVFSSFEQNQLFRELLHLCNLPSSVDYSVNAVLIHILSELCRLSEGTEVFDHHAEEIYEWIRVNASATLRAETVADYFKLSEDHISRILQRCYGYGLKKLTTRFITAKAKDLLCNTEFYVKEIAAKLGFSSDKAFIGFFKYHEGASPEQFRNRFSKTHMNNK